MQLTSASTEEDIYRSSQEDQPTNVDLRQKLKWFNVAQTASLKCYYGNGIVGTGKIFFTQLPVIPNSQLIK